MSEFTRQRFSEIAFYNIYTHMRKVIVDTYFEMYVQTLCRVFDIDYTSITILQNMYLRKMKPSKYELAIFATLVNMPYKNIPVDYRTIRKYKKRYYDEGEPHLYPRVRNKMVLEDLVKFVKAYTGFYNNDLEYIRNLEIGDDNNA